MTEIHRAEYLLPIASEPILSGGVAVENGAIVAVGTADEIAARFPVARVTDHGRAAILPGFVNCHSHLELTAMRGRLDRFEHDFRSWLLQLNAIRAAMSDDEIRSSVSDGIREGFAAGVTFFGDVSRKGSASIDAMIASGCRGVMYQETEFSPDTRTADRDFRELMTRVIDLQERATDLVTVGISPHSPYTVSSSLFEMLAQTSIIDRIPLAIHAAESDDEVGLLNSGEGFFTGVYEKLQVEWVYPGCSPIAYLERLGVLAAKPLLIHCVKTSDDDHRRMAHYGVAVAHCPRSNAKFGHGWAPLEAMIGAGIEVGLGSDSVASNNICDILAESTIALLAARNHPERKSMLTPRDTLHAATLGGAKAMGLDDKIGSLDIGKQADIAIVDLHAGYQQPVTDVESALVFSSSGRDVKTTIIAGRVVYER